MLAAGGSARLGRPKQLVRYRNQPLLLRALALAEALTPGRVVVVLGAGATRLRKLVRDHGGGARVAYNRHWHDGMASSLTAGLGLLPDDAKAALVLLSDQPKVSLAAARALVGRWRRQPSWPAAASYGDRVGVPAVLPRRLWREARRLRGDVGARALLRGCERVALISMPEAAIDVDTAADLAALDTRR